MQMTTSQMRIRIAMLKVKGIKKAMNIRMKAKIK